MDKRRLDLPKHERELFPRNVVRQVVAELRFPTLLELETESPRELRQELRRDYPHFAVGDNVTLNPGTTTSRHEPQYAFKSRDQAWTFVLRPSALSLETAKYVRFSDFAARLNRIIEAASKHLELVFFTRIGLRYVNALPAKQGDVQGWVNPALVGPLGEPRLGWLTECFQQLHGYAQAGRYSLRHGIEPGKDGAGDYIIDTDFYREDVDVAEATELLTTLNRESFTLFTWTLGERALRYMREGKEDAAQ